MARYILILIFLSALWSCDEDIQKELATAKLEINFIGAMSVTSKATSDGTSKATPAEMANLIKHMRIFLFEPFTGDLKHEITNFERNTTGLKVTSAYLPVGNWEMIAVSSLEDENVHFAPNENINFVPIDSRNKNKLLYKFQPTASASGGEANIDCPQIVTSVIDLEVTENEDIKKDALFKRAVGKVVVKIADVEHASIDRNSLDHTVTIEGVPTSLNFEGALLNSEGIASRDNPVILNSSDPPSMEKTISAAPNAVGVEFIVPAYYSDENEDIKNKKLTIYIRLAKKMSVGGGYFYNEGILTTSLTANGVLNVNILIREQTLLITTTVSPWNVPKDEVIIPFQ